jgi:hypothetical protein
MRSFCIGCLATLSLLFFHVWQWQLLTFHE